MTGSRREWGTGPAVAGDHPALVRAAAEFDDGHGGDEGERATHASKTVIRPLAARGTEESP